MKKSNWLICWVTFFISKTCIGIDIDPTSIASLKKGAAMIADDIMNVFYDPAGVVGEFPPPVYWWQAGATWGDMINYWYITGDSQYNDRVQAAMLNQVGDDQDYMPRVHYASLGNDDQAFWGFSAMLAAERKFPDPPKNQPQWLSLAMAVFNRMTEVWDTGSCNGGLRWQKFTKNKGYDYKNTISNGGLFLLSARLARYTKNDTYAEWSNKVWDWITTTEMVDETTMSFYDGQQIIGDKCAPLGGEGRIQWSYNIGTFLGGMAALYDYTKDPVWLQRLHKVIPRIKDIFTHDGILYESACEPHNTCKVNEPSFKGYLIRWLAYTAELVPEFVSEISPILSASAVGAGKSCTGGSSGRLCGTQWYIGSYDNTGPKLGNEQSALEAMIGTILVNSLPKYSPPATEKEGTSKGNPSAGTGERTRIGEVEIPEEKFKITNSSLAGAVVITIVYITALISFGIYCII